MSHEESRDSCGFHEVFACEEGIPECAFVLLDTLQVCRDFKYGQCVRPACKFVHLLEAVTFEAHTPRKTVFNDLLRQSPHNQEEEQPASVSLRLVPGKPSLRRPVRKSQDGKCLSGCSPSVCGVAVKPSVFLDYIEARPARSEMLRQGRAAVSNESPVPADHVEVTDMKVSVCRDAVKGKCGRGLCKYYHLPVVLPPAPLDPHSARAPQSGPRHHGLHNPPNNPLMLDNAHYMDNTTKPAPTPSNNNSSMKPPTSDRHCREVPSYPDTRQAEPGHPPCPGPPARMLYFSFIRIVTSVPGSFPA
ncbi:muscleblind-like protein 3 [Penaeus chinensis]|uniref:muscleblind-like protein 3 n=1 Tax=Penaeus chinensis TaxID=139456 RepID=UPI001FB6E888|nr:muscleblind-like protein 3 [Penaeus chinensis]